MSCASSSSVLLKLQALIYVYRQILLVSKIEQAHIARNNRITFNGKKPFVTQSSEVVPHNVLNT